MQSRPSHSTVRLVVIAIGLGFGAGCRNGTEPIDAPWFRADIYGIRDTNLTGQAYFSTLHDQVTISMTDADSTGAMVVVRAPESLVTRPGFYLFSDERITAELHLSWQGVTPTRFVLASGALEIFRNGRGRLRGWVLGRWQGTITTATGEEVVEVAVRADFAAARRSR